MITLQKDSGGKGGIIRSKDYGGKIDGSGNITSYNTDGTKKG